MVPPPRQGQGQEQAGDELGGDISGEAEEASLEPSLQPQGEVFPLHRHAMGAQFLQERPQGALGKAAASLEEPLPSQGGGHGQQEAQGASRLSAIQERASLPGCLEGGQGRAGRLQVFGGGSQEADGPRGHARQGGANHLAVGNGLGGGDFHLSPPGPGLEDDLAHGRRRSPASSATGSVLRTQRPRHSGTTRVNSFPLRFLSWSIASARRSQG